MFQNITSFISLIGMFVVTLFYVIYNKKILKANQGMFEEATIARKQESMPNIILYFDMFKINALNLVVENIGKSVAIDTRITLEPIIDFPRPIRLQSSNLLNEVLTTIAPSQRLLSFVDSLPNLKNKNGDFPKFLATVEFNDVEGKKYSFKYTLDINIWKGSTRLGDEMTMNDLVKEIGDIKDIMRGNNR